LIALLFILTAIFVYIIVRDIFHPSFIMFTIWTIGVIFISLIPSFFMPSDDSLLVIYFYLSIFSFSSILFGSMSKKLYSPKFRNPKVDVLLLKFLSLILFAGLIYYLSRYVSIIMSYSSLAEYFYHIRYAAIHAGEPLITTGYYLTQIKTFSMVFSLILFNYLIDIKKSRNFKIFICFFISLVLMANVVEGSRNEFVFLSISYMFIYIYKRGSRNIFKILTFSFLVFFVLTVQTRGGGLGDNIFLSYLNHMILYSFGSLVSFEGFLNNDIQVSSSIVVKFVNLYNKLANHFPFLSLLDHPPVKSAAFTMVSDELRMNVYSFLSVRIHYLGYIGAAVSIILHSLLITITYDLRSNKFFYYCYCFMIPTVLLSLFHDYFFSFIPYYYRTFIVILFLYYIKPFSRYGKILLPVKNRHFT